MTDDTPTVWHECMCPTCGAPARWRHYSRQNDGGSLRLIHDDREYETLHMGPGLAKLKAAAAEALTEIEAHMNSIAADQPLMRAYWQRVYGLLDSALKECQ